MTQKFNIIMNLDEFTRAYLCAALWSSDDGEQPLDKRYSLTDLSVPTLQRAVAECAAFQSAQYDRIQSDLTTAGYDFWLTRNGHGAGFFDGDWPSDGEALTAACGQYPSIDLYVGDDGQIWS